LGDEVLKQLHRIVGRGDMQRSGAADVATVHAEQIFRELQNVEFGL